MAISVRFVGSTEIPTSHSAEGGIFLGMTDTPVDIQTVRRHAVPPHNEKAPLARGFFQTMESLSSRNYFNSTIFFVAEKLPAVSL